MNCKTVAAILILLAATSCAPKEALKPTEPPAPAATLTLPDVEPKKETVEEKKTAEKKTVAPARPKRSRKSSTSCSTSRIPT